MGYSRQFSPSFAIAAYLRASNLLNESVPEEADVAAQRQRAVKLLKYDVILVDFFSCSTSLPVVASAGSQ